MVSEQGYNDQDGFGFQNNEGIVREFLAPGSDFKEKIARGGFSIEDAMDWGEIWRVGISYRVPVMVEHADHAVTASIGQDRLGRTEAIQAITGSRQHAAELAAKKNGVFKFGRKGGNAEDGPQMLDARMGG